MSGELVAHQQVSMSTMAEMAKAIADSGMFGVKTAPQALALMLVAQAQGISPAQACVDFDVIQGKPAMTARAMLARFQQAGGVIKWIQYTDEACEAEFTHAQCPEPISIKWTMKDAIRAGLTGKENWKKYPRQMLSSRVMSEGVDRCYPAASGGFYPPEVVSDFKPERNVTPNAGAGDDLTDQQRARMDILANDVRGWIADGVIGDAFLEIENAACDVEEKRYLWSLLDSKQRSALKREGERVRKALPAPQEAPQAATSDRRDEDSQPRQTISEPQRKRLEGIITGRGISRATVKGYCKTMWDVDHFADLSPAEYQQLDEWLTNFKESAAHPAESARTGTGTLPPVESDATADTYITKEQVKTLLDLLQRSNYPGPKFLKQAGIETLDTMLTSDFDEACEALTARLPK